MANTIRIFNWRQHGDDENYVRLSAYPDGTEGDPEAEIREQYGIGERTGEEIDDDTPTRSTIYVNDDITLASGDVLEHNGRKFRLTIEEVQ